VGSHEGVQGVDLGFVPIVPVVLVVLFGFNKAVIAAGKQRQDGDNPSHHGQRMLMLVSLMQFFRRRWSKVEKMYAAGADLAFESIWRTDFEISIVCMHFRIVYVQC
jgi:hypothetical protein